MLAYGQVHQNSSSYINRCLFETTLTRLELPQKFVTSANKLISRLVPSWNNSLEMQIRAYLKICSGIGFTSPQPLRHPNKVVFPHAWVPGDAATLSGRAAEAGLGAGPRPGPSEGVALTQARFMEALLM
jgi:hypothetical protein